MSASIEVVSVSKQNFGKAASCAASWRCPSAVSTKIYSCGVLCTFNPDSSGSVGASAEFSAVSGCVAANKSIWPEGFLDPLSTTL